MIRRHLLAAAFAACATLSCTEALAPSRFGRYDWRLFVPFDSLGTPMVDTLSFHWPSSSLPVKIWVEDSFGMPAHVQHGIDLWASAFLYNEYNATLVSDSSVADVIVRTIQPPVKPAPPLAELHGRLFAGCEGETRLDTVATRRELSIPIHVFVFPKYNPNTFDLTQCFSITAAHELGHSLGLFQHSADTLDVMYSDPLASALSARDIRTVETTYHWPVNFVPVRP